MATPGRNDPCPCGSGRKFKHCCLGRDDAEAAARLSLRRAEGRIVRDVLAWAPVRFGGMFIRAAVEDFYRGEPPDPEERDEAEFDQMFVPWFVFGYVADPHGALREPDWPSVPLARCWADDETPDLSTLERAFLAAACDSPLSVFVVEAVEPGRSLDVRDVLTGRRFHVLEQQASRDLRKADLHFTRVVTAGGASIMVGGSPLAVPPDRHTDVLEWRDGLFRRRTPTRHDLAEFDVEIRDFYFDLADALRNPEPPIVRNTDGEDFVPTTMTWDLTVPVADAFDRLKPLAVVGDDEYMEDVSTDEAGVVTAADFFWTKAGNRQQKSWTNTTLGSLHLEAGRLTAEVNSVERADRLIREVRKRIRRGATLASWTVEDLEASLAAMAAAERSGAGSRPAADADIERPSELVAMEAELRRQYSIEWLDTPVPALGGSTPREAVQTAGGRERVEALLAGIERRAEDLGWPDDEVFLVMRRELGLV